MRSQKIEAQKIEELKAPREWGVVSPSYTYLLLFYLG